MLRGIQRKLRFLKRSHREQEHENVLEIKQERVKGDRTRRKRKRKAK